MVTLAATTQPPQQKKRRQPAPPPPVVLTPAQVTAAIAAALAVAVTAAALAAMLAKIMKGAGIGLLALRAVAALMMSWPQGVLEGTGPAQRAMVRLNRLRRAQFMLAACKRVQAAIAAARAQHEPVRAALADALAAEKRYMGLSHAADDGRIRAATTVDAAAEKFGDPATQAAAREGTGLAPGTRILLGWNAVMDSRTTAECRAANGKSFYADKPPQIGYPGTVHVHCRCVPGRPLPGAPILP